MATKEELKAAGNHSLNMLTKFMHNETKLAYDCNIFQRKKKKEHLKMANYYESLVKKVGDNPDSITIACRVPDWVLAKMGWG